MTDFSRIIRASELADRLGISRVTLWRWERNGLLPPKRRVGPNVVGWLESEISEWVAARPAVSSRESGAPDTVQSGALDGDSN